MAGIPNQMVVVTEHLHLVGNALASHGLERGYGTRANPRLGLTLVDLPDDPVLTEVVQQLLDDPGPKSAPPVGGAAGPPVDRLLAATRWWFGTRFDGWAPTMGKNRLLNGVELLPYVSAHGSDRPECVTPPEGRAAARATWPADPGARPVRVGVIDTRVVPHPRLAGGYLTAPDGLDVAPPPDGRFWWQGHATFVGDLVLTQAPSALLDMRRGFDVVAGDQDTRARMRLWSFAERLGEFADAGVQVLNCSMGCATDDGRPPLVLERAISRLTAGMVVVAAAGNHGANKVAPDGHSGGDRPETPGAPMFPAALDGVLSVGALNDDGEVADFNPRGADERSWAPWIDVFTPGTNVVGAYLGDGADEAVRMPDGPPVGFRGWATWSGTSFSAATMTGILAARIAAGSTPQQAEAAVRRDSAFRRAPA